MPSRSFAWTNWSSPKMIYLVNHLHDPPQPRPLLVLGERVPSSLEATPHCRERQSCALRVLLASVICEQMKRTMLSGTMIRPERFTGCFVFQRSDCQEFESLRAPNETNGLPKTRRFDGKNSTVAVLHNSS